MIYAAWGDPYMSKDAASHVKLAEGFLAKGRDLI